jgi:glycosyltransferase involved in cell wall biosynthesis
MKIEIRFFQEVTIISENLKSYLNIKRAAHVIPLGVERIVDSHKKIDGVSLLYVGTLKNRRIQETILGYAMFLEDAKNKTRTHYTIIGFGNKEEENLIKETIRDFHLHQEVHFIGRVPHSELREYFESHNIGISYIPITKYFDFQPPTKTLEYLSEGLICVATKTVENKNIIRESNGILCEDNPISLCAALIELNSKIDQFTYKGVTDQLSELLWINVVEKKLKPLIEELIV